MPRTLACSGRNAMETYDYKRPNVALAQRNAQDDSGVSLRELSSPGKSIIVRTTKGETLTFEVRRIRGKGCLIVKINGSQMLRGYERRQPSHILLVTESDCFKKGRDFTLTIDGCEEERHCVAEVWLV